VSVGYKYFYAQTVNKNLYKHLQINPIAVTGIVKINNHLVFGKRSMNITQFPGLWELVPSGVVSKESLINGNIIDCKKQILLELSEELKIAPNFVLNAKHAFIHYDNFFHITEFVYELELAPILLKKLEKIKTDEYDEVRCVKVEDVKFFLENNSNIVPIAITILRYKNYI